MSAEKIDTAKEAILIAEKAKSKGALIVTFDYECVEIGAHNLSTEDFRQIIALLREIHDE